MNMFHYRVNILFLILISCFTNKPAKSTLAQTSTIISGLSNSQSDFKTDWTNIDNPEILDLKKKALYNTLVKAKLTESIKKNKLDLLNTKNILPFDYSSINVATDSGIIAEKSNNKFNELNNDKSELVKTENTKYLIPKLPQLQTLPEFTIADIIPIERDDIKPPDLDNIQEDIKQEPTQVPDFNPSDKKPENQQELQNQQKQVVLDSLSISTIKYPWIINPTDNFTFAPQLFRPNKKANYIDVDIRFAEDNPIINKLTYANYPKKDQFYWVLNENKIVIETKGYQAGIVYQGRGIRQQSIQEVTSSQAFWGLQSVFNIPVAFENLDGEVAIEEQNFSIASTAGKIINPEGIPAGRVIINSGVDENNPNVTVLRNSSSSIGSASTNSPNGGGELFSNLDAVNSPKILQAYPTTNLQPLLETGEVALREGETIPKNSLESAGIFWGDILTGEGFGFTPSISSSPGIKVAQEGKFDNQDLLNILVNPSLSQGERDVHYLNSLFWTSLGRRQPEFKVLSESEDSYDWYRFFLSYNHNRSIIQYDPTKVSATYTNLFSNYGFSLTTRFSDSKIDGIQAINSTFGMILGTIFKNIKVDIIDDSLQVARDKFNNRQKFDALKTASTPVQRKQMNQRLNLTLNYANSSSNLQQVSGTYTFPSKITPKKSRIFQIRTGNHKRVVQFINRDINIIREGDTFFSELRLSNESFGPLTYIGAQIPLNKTGIEPVNESSAIEVILTNAQGRQFVQRFNSSDNTSVPVNARGADLAFDYMELTRIDDVRFKWNSFDGYLSLPAIELLAAGTSGNFNYGASLGTWFNVDADSAPNVNNNNLGLQEPTIGIYTNARLNYVKRNVELDSEKKPVALNTHAPSLVVNWNSASNRNNPFSTFLSYYFERQEKKLGYSITSGIAFVENNSNLEFIGILNGEFSTNKGLNLKARFEIGKNIFYSFEGLQRINDYFSTGLYFRSYSVNNIGLSSRNSGLNYGLIARQKLKFNNVFLEAQAGTGDNGFDVRFKGGYRF